MQAQTLARPHRLPKWMAVFLLIITAIVIALSVDTSALAQAAYSIPMLLWRGLTYALIIMKARRSTRIPLAGITVLNEMMIYGHYTGAVQ